MKIVVSTWDAYIVNTEARADVMQWLEEIKWWKNIYNGELTLEGL
jgi:hypothetical protein